MSNAKKYAIMIDELMESLEEGDFFHSDANRDRANDKGARVAQKAPEKCPMGQLRSKITGRCTSIRGGFNRS